MPYSIEFKRSAEKELSRLSESLQDRIIEAVDGLASNPRPAGVKKLSGVDKTYRVRVGEYRIVYEIEDKILRVLIVRIAGRKDVYT